MLWIIERILERLFLKSALQLSSRKEADLELAHIESRAELLRKARELEEEKVPGFEQLAVSLRNKAADLEIGAAAPGADVIRIADELKTEQERKAPRISSDEKEKAPALPAPAGKKRGRPRKHPLPDALENNGDS